MITKTQQKRFDKIRKRIQSNKFVNDFDRIDFFLRVQDGYINPPFNDLEKYCDWTKIKINPNSKKEQWQFNFGVPILVRYKLEKGEDYIEDRGYLTSMPGFCDDADMCGIVHLIDVDNPGGKENVENQWFTLYELLCNKYVIEILWG